RMVRGPASNIFCLQLRRQESCEASPCCDLLSNGIDSLSISVSSMGRCNVSSVLRVFIGGRQVRPFINYPMQYTDGVPSDVGLSIYDMSTLGLDADNLEVCFELRKTCTDWTDFCRPGVPSSSAGCRFAVNEANADGWYMCCNTCEVNTLPPPEFSSVRSAPGVFIDSPTTKPPPNPKPPPPNRRPPPSPPPLKASPPPKQSPSPQPPLILTSDGTPSQQPKRPVPPVLLPPSPNPSLPSPRPPSRDSPLASPTPTPPQPIPPPSPPPPP
ncbi:hypothetical protein Vretimale_16778, partial [Volvox reticuliferus]